MIYTCDDKKNKTFFFIHKDDRNIVGNETKVSERVDWYAFGSWMRVRQETKQYTVM